MRVGMDKLFKTYITGICIARAVFLLKEAGLTGQVLDSTKN